VATVDPQTGLITAVSGGTAIITATSAADTTKTAAAVVNVTIPLTGLSLPATLGLHQGQTQPFTLPYVPSNTTQTGITWTSSNPGVAAVDTAGRVTAVAEGTATITATSTANPGITAACTVTVSNPLTGISIPAVLTLGTESNFPMPVTFFPADTTETGLSWTSDNTAVATVTDGMVTAVGTGTAVITATSTASPGITATCTVTVQASFTGAGVNIVFSGFEDETFTLDAALNGTDTLVVTAPAGFDRYLWYVDYDFRGTTPTRVLNTYASNLLPGLHYLTVIVDQGGYHFSKTLTFRVGY
jgi:uncharacterized protein YjdB